MLKLGKSCILRSTGSYLTANEPSLIIFNFMHTLRSCNDHQLNGPAVFNIVNWEFVYNPHYLLIALSASALSPRHVSVLLSSFPNWLESLHREKGGPMMVRQGALRPETYRLCLLVRDGGGGEGGLGGCCIWIPQPCPLSPPLLSHFS